jgi:hypothetical protein
VEKHTTVFLARTRNALRAHLWGAVGKATAFVALGNWPEGVHRALHAVHEHAYFKWADAARHPWENRETPPARCVACSKRLVDVPGVVNLYNYRGLNFCTDKCRVDFVRDVKVSHPVMPS